MAQREYPPPRCPLPFQMFWKQFRCSTCGLNSSPGDHPRATTYSRPFRIRARNFSMLTTARPTVPRPISCVPSLAETRTL